MVVPVQGSVPALRRAQHGQLCDEKWLAISQMPRSHLSETFYSQRHENLMEKTRHTLVAAVLPDGNGGYGPCPELLTEAEAIRYLRLDTLELQNPADTLRYYRNKRVLRATPISNHLFYRRQALDDFLEKVTKNDAEMP